jgi:hypothetical protein
VPWLELRAAGEAALGSDDNDDNRRNNDNEPSDDLNVDRLVAIWRPHLAVTAAAGQNHLPLELSALVWDEDLRPAGASVAARFAWRDFDAWRFAAGGFGVRSLGDDWVQLASVQAGLSIRDGAPTGAEARLAALYFDRTDALVGDGMARTNSVQAGDFVADFQLLDLQIGLRHVVWRVPAALDAEWVENLGADAASSGWRGAARCGDLAARGDVEIGYAYHRIERDAVLAAFNSDDWWFHSAMRGHRVTLSVAVVRALSLGVSGSWERRDDLTTWTRRLLLDLRLHGGD